MKSKHFKRIQLAIFALLGVYALSALASVVKTTTNIKVVDAPPPTSGGDFSFLAYGDSRGESLVYQPKCEGNQAHISLVNKMVNEAASFVVHLGDMVAGAVGSTTNWVNDGDCVGADRTGSLKKIIAPLMAKTPAAGLSSFFIPVIGNHDDAWSDGGYPDKFGGGFCDVFNSVLSMIPNHTSKSYFAGTFGLPNGGRYSDADFFSLACSKTKSDVYPNYFYYSFNVKNSHFVVLRINSDYYDLTANLSQCTTKPYNYDKCYYIHQLDWLNYDLAETAKNSSIENIFVFLHAPLFTSSDGHAANVSWTTLNKIFTKNKVKIVFQGHNHVYERSYPIAFTDANPNGVRDDVNGTIYTTTGGGGSGFHGFNGPNSLIPVQKTEIHYLKVDVSGTKISVKALKPNGEVIDSYSR